MRLGLDGGELLDLVHAAELHDIGKLAVPAQILRKPGPLDEEEWAVMRRHTLLGEGILGAASALGSVATLVRSSHERYDGAGYPDGLAGEAIPLASRIVLVCDAFDAMTSARPTQGVREQQAALAECAAARRGESVRSARRRGLLRRARRPARAASRAVAAA